MTLPTFAEFETRLRAEGFDEVLERHWPPDKALATHTHPFAVKALVAQGEMWLAYGGRTLHLCAGDGFELDREVPHDEHYGAQGTTVWVARRHVC